MKCEECFSSEALFLCIECEQALCKVCEESLHKGGKRRSHNRPLVCRNCRNQAVTQCIQCVQNLCLNCHPSHSSHSLQSITAQKRIGVFWDLSSCRLNRPEDIQMVVTEIQQKIGPSEFIKTYGDPWGKWKDSLSAFGIISVHKSGIKTYEALLLDLSISLNTGLTHVLVISAQSQTFTPHLLQLKSNIPKVEFWLSSRILPLQIQETLVEENKVQRNSYLDVIVNYLKDEAIKGNVLIELAEFLQVISGKLKLDGEEVGRILETAEKSGLVFISCKEFDKTTTNFVSLRMENCSLECLIWTLRSLRLDEMLPSEKAIQARMREVFDFKPSPNDWQNLIQQARGHSHSSSAPAEFSLFSKSPSLPKFTFKEITDQSNGSRTLLIYPNGENWSALDNHSKYGDYLNIKETAEWKDFLRFLECYFTPKGIRRPKKEEEQKAIPGGRYGCAQFIKICGPPALKNCSLGKLSYMVQLAINEDYLRYQRTLLIWTTNNQGIISRSEMLRKLQIIKSTIISLLEKSQDGVSLAQLPLYLKRSLNFPLNISELGFAKLKDLLATFPEVAIELRDTNHPFAVLCRDNKYIPPRVESILGCISMALGEHKFGLAESKLELQVVGKLGRIDWGAYRTSSLSEFVHTFGRDNFEVIKTKDSHMIFKSKQPGYSYFYESIRECSWDSVNDRAFSPTIMQHSTSLSMEREIPGHMGKIVNISALPPDIMKDEIEEPNYFFESYNDSSTDFSYSLTGFSAPRATSGTTAKYDAHYKTHSEGVESKASDSGKTYWLDSMNIGPPPGFPNVNK